MLFRLFVCFVFEVGEEREGPSRDQNWERYKRGRDVRAAIQFVSKDPHRGVVVVSSDEST